MFHKNFIHPTPRLKIRFYQIEDFSSWQRLFHDMRSQQNQWDWVPEKLENLTQERYLNKLENHKKERELGKCLYFCVEETLTERLIGIGLLNHITENEAELGFQLNNKYWGQGYGQEIAQGLKEVAFEHLNITKLFALVNPENVGSLSILNKLQFIKMGVNDKGQVILHKSR